MHHILNANLKTQITKSTSI